MKRNLKNGEYANKNSTVFFIHKQLYRFIQGYLQAWVRLLHRYVNKEGKGNWCFFFCFAMKNLRLNLTHTGPINQGQQWYHRLHGFGSFQAVKSFRKTIILSLHITLSICPFKGMIDHYRPKAFEFFFFALMRTCKEE